MSHFCHVLNTFYKVLIGSLCSNLASYLRDSQVCWRASCVCFCVSSEHAKFACLRVASYMLYWCARVSGVIGMHVWYYYIAFVVSMKRADLMAINSRRDDRMTRTVYQALL